MLQFLFCGFNVKHRSNVLFKHRVLEVDVALFTLGAPVTSALAQFSENEKMKRNVSFLYEGKPVQVFGQPCLFAYL